MAKKSKTSKKNKKKGISQEKLHGLTFRLVGIAMWLLLLALVLSVGIIGTQRMYSFGYQVFTDEDRDAEDKDIEIIIGEDAGKLSIALQLEKQGLIDSAAVFLAQSFIFDLDVNPGTYVINLRDSSRQLLETFDKGADSTS